MRSYRAKGSPKRQAHFSIYRKPLFGLMIPSEFYSLRPGNIKMSRISKLNTGTRYRPNSSEFDFQISYRDRFFPHFALRFHNFDQRDWHEWSQTAPRNKTGRSLSMALICGLRPSSKLGHSLTWGVPLCC